MSVDNNGPRHLDKLAGMLPSMAKAATSTAHRNPAKTMSFKPTKICPICGDGHARVLCATNKEIETAYCPDCQQKFDEGDVAFATLAGRYLWLNGANLPPDVRGKFQVITDEMFDSILKRAGGTMPDATAN